MRGKSALDEGCVCSDIQKFMVNWARKKKNNHAYTGKSINNPSRQSTLQAISLWKWELQHLPDNVNIHGFSGDVSLQDAHISATWQSYHAREVLPQYIRVFAELCKCGTCCVARYMAAWSQPLCHYIQAITCIRGTKFIDISLKSLPGQHF